MSTAIGIYRLDGAGDERDGISKTRGRSIDEDLGNAVEGPHLAAYRRSPRVSVESKNGPDRKVSQSDE